MALRAMLLSAPLPGGRGDGYCDDSGLDDYLEEELLSEGNDEDMTIITMKARRIRATLIRY